MSSSRSSSSTTTNTSTATSGDVTMSTPTAGQDQATVLGSGARQTTGGGFGVGGNLNAQSISVIDPGSFAFGRDVVNATLGFGRELAQSAANQNASVTSAVTQAAAQQAEANRQAVQEAAALGRGDTTKAASWIPIAIIAGALVLIFVLKKGKK